MLFSFISLMSSSIDSSVMHWPLCGSCSCLLTPLMYTALPLTSRLAWEISTFLKPILVLTVSMVLLPFRSSIASEYRFGFSALQRSGDLTVPWKAAESEAIFTHDVSTSFPFLSQSLIHAAAFFGAWVPPVLRNTLNSELQ